MSVDEVTGSLVRLDPPSAAAPVSLYSHGILAPRNGQWLHVSGQVGLHPDGSHAAGFEDQARLAWDNLIAVLRAADMDVTHLVKVTTFLTDSSQLPLFGPIRARYLGDARPASTLLIVQALARPEWQVEIEAIACRA